MTAMVESALADGACGTSSGLEYTPGAFASRDELIALCRPLANRRLPYATHMRNEDDRLLDAIDESIAVARGAGCPLQISHLKTQGPRNWTRLDEVFRHIDDGNGNFHSFWELVFGGQFWRAFDNPAMIQGFVAGANKVWRAVSPSLA